MNDKSLIAKLNRETKEIKEVLRPVIKSLGALEEKKYSAENLRPLSILGESIEHKCISITPGIIIDAGVGFKHIAENEKDTAFKDLWLDDQIIFSTRYRPEYNLKEVFYNKQDRCAKELAIKKNLADDMILELEFYGEWIKLSRTLKKHLRYERYVNAIPIEINRFKQDIELAKKYVNEMITGKKPKFKKTSLTEKVEKAMTKLVAKAEPIHKIHDDEQKHDAALDALEKQGYWIQSYIGTWVWTKPIQDNDVEIKLVYRGDSNSREMHFAHKYRPKKYEQPEEECPKCRGDYKYQDSFGIGLEFNKSNKEIYRHIPYDLNLLEKELERFRRDILLIKNYEWDQLIKNP